MSSEGASAALMLKHKIQQVQEELDRYKNLYDQSKQELEAEKKKRSQVLVARWAWPPLCRFAAYMTNTTFLAKMLRRNYVCMDVLSLFHYCQSRSNITLH